MRTVIRVSGYGCTLSGLPSYIKLDISDIRISLDGSFGPLKIDITRVLPTLAAYPMSKRARALDAIIGFSVRRRIMIVYASTDSGWHETEQENEFYIEYEACLNHFQILRINTEKTLPADGLGAFFVRRNNRTHYLYLGGMGEGSFPIMVAEELKTGTNSEINAIAGSSIQYFAFAFTACAPTITMPTLSLEEIQSIPQVGGVGSGKANEKFRFLKPCDAPIAGGFGRDLAGNLGFDLDYDFYVSRRFVNNWNSEHQEGEFLTHSQTNRAVQIKALCSSRSPLWTSFYVNDSIGYHWRAQTIRRMVVKEGAAGGAGGGFCTNVNFRVSFAYELVMVPDCTLCVRELMQSSVGANGVDGDILCVEQIASRSVSLGTYDRGFHVRAVAAGSGPALGLPSVICFGTNNTRDVAGGEDVTNVPTLDVPSYSYISRTPKFAISQGNQLVEYVVSQSSARGVHSATIGIQTGDEAYPLEFTGLGACGHHHQRIDVVLQ